MNVLNDPSTKSNISQEDILLKNKKLNIYVDFILWLLRIAIPYEGLLYYYKYYFQYIENVLYYYIILFSYLLTPPF